MEFDRYFTVKTLSGKELRRAFRIQDIVEGHLRISMPKIGKDNDLVFIPCTATYCQEKDRVEIHFRIVAEKTPAAFRDNIPQGCIILRRVEP